MKLIIFLSILILVKANLYSVDYRNKIYNIRLGQPNQFSLAWGHYQHDVNEDGWGKLYITTSNLYDSHEFSLLTYFAAGYLEGALMSEQIYQHYWSWWDYTFKGGLQAPSEATAKWVFDQDDYARQLVDQNPGDEYYEALARVIAQNDGIYSGIQENAQKEYKMSKLDLLYLQGCGDMYEIIPATTPSQKVMWHQLIGEQLKWTWEQTVSCSAMVKATDDWGEVFAGHTTWTSYQNMLRTYKYYNFQGGPKALSVSFSAKPGLIYSKDDFYVLPDQNMVVMETTNGVLNSSLYDLVIPQSLLTWQRVPIANQLAHNGEEWTELFIRHNSGTYNNQYMVVDMKTMQNQVPTSGFLWISETMPGMARRSDVTQTFINQGNVWPSYNVPFDRDIYIYGGFQDAFERGGDYYSYENCPRAQLFRRDHHNVNSIESFQTLLRYNDYQNDPISQNNPAYAIASRYDLRTTNPVAFGAIDAKITSNILVANNQAWIQSGPSHDIQSVFEWANWTGVHLGQPESFNFGWVLAEDRTNTNIFIIQ